MKKLLNYIFRRNLRFVKWNEQAVYTLEFTDINVINSGVFNFIIYFYPHRFGNKYILEVTPESIEFYPHKKFYYHQHTFYKNALKKLKELEEGNLMETILA